MPARRWAPTRHLNTAPGSTGPSSSTAGRSRQSCGVNPRFDRGAVVAASIAAGLGAASAAVSAYWASGGTALLDTIGGEIERWGRQRSEVVVIALWVVVVVKLVG